MPLPSRSLGNHVIPERIGEDEDHRHDKTVNGDGFGSSPGRRTKVRVMVVAASGCCASELKAVETARPSPRAGAMLPSAIVSPAVMIEAVAIKVVLSMGSLS